MMTCHGGPVAQGCQTLCQGLLLQSQAPQTGQCVSVCLWPGPPVRPEHPRVHAHTDSMAASQQGGTGGGAHRTKGGTGVRGVEGWWRHLAV